MTIIKRNSSGAEKPPKSIVQYMMPTKLLSKTGFCLLNSTKRIHIKCQKSIVN